MRVLSFSSEQLTYASGHLLDAFGIEAGLCRGPTESCQELRGRVMRDVFGKQSPAADGGSAFPEPSGAQCGGMTLRDYFAAKAMQAMIAKYGCQPVANQELAANSYGCADAMLAERAK